MQVIRWEDAQVRIDKDDIKARKFFEYEGSEFIVIKLNGFSELKKHKTPVDALFFVIQGKGEFFVGEENLTASQGTVIFSPKNIEHGFKNSSEKELQVLVMKLK
ncbi:MAG TPA: cupin domain-containing protein [Petrotogaceae bacterium]|nr:cupin domain-containing protein [Petrotogaceae bacterium]HQF33095.1 cupin domain-containing protein [Petrotogaceae bacterium]